MNTTHYNFDITLSSYLPPTLLQYVSTYFDEQIDLLEIRVKMPNLLNLERDAEATGYVTVAQMEKAKSIDDLVMRNVQRLFTRLYMQMAKQVDEAAGV